MKHTVHFKDVPANCHAASVLLHKVYTQIERKAWNRSRKNFLDTELELKGDLVCCYCGRTGLKRNTGKQNERATVDHVQPMAKGGDALRHDNFVVSCDTCNRKKADTPVSDFTASKYLKNKKKS